MKFKSQCCGKPVAFPFDYPAVPSTPSCTKCRMACGVVNKEIPWYKYDSRRARWIWNIAGFMGFWYLVANVQLSPPLEFIKDIPWVGGFLWFCHGLLCFALFIGWIFCGFCSGCANLSTEEILSEECYWNK